MRAKGVGTGGAPTDENVKPISAAQTVASPVSAPAAEKKAAPKASSKTASLAKAASSDKIVPEELF